MQFKVGDRVVHPTYGVSHIDRLEERQLAEDESRLYYVLIADKTTVWVLVEARAEIALRQVTPRGDLDRYRRLLKGLPDPLAKDHVKRRAQIADRLRQGSFLALCETVRDLAARGWRRPLNDADSSLLQRLRVSMCREWAASSGVTLAEALDEVDALLSEARRVSMT